MTTSKETMTFLLDQLSGVSNLTTKRMFGEYCIYISGIPIGFVSDDQLHLKMTNAGRRMAPDAEEGFPYPDAKPHLLITADFWDDRDWLAELIRGCSH